MTQNNGDVARRVLGVLAEVKDLFRIHSVEIRRLPGVRSTLHAVEVVKYESGPVLEGYVDVELTDGTILSWLLDVTWTQDSWVIEARMAKSTKGEQDTLQSLPTSTVRDLDEFLDTLVETVRRLFALRPSASADVALER